MSVTHSLARFNTLTQKLHAGQKQELKQLCNVMAEKHLAVTRDKTTANWESFILASNGVTTFLDNTIDAIEQLFQNTQDADAKINQAMGIGELQRLKNDVITTYPTNNAPQSGIGRVVNILQMSDSMEKFNGDFSQYHPKLFLLNIRTTQKRAGLSEAQTAELLLACCKKDSLAEKWAQGILMWEHDKLSNLDALEKNFLAYFQGKADVQQKVSLQTGLYQRTQETIQGFYQRVRNATYILCDDIIKDELLSDADNTRIMEAARNREIRKHLVNGMQTELRAMLTQVNKIDAPLPELLEAAVQSEAARNTSTKSKPLKGFEINAMEMQTEEEVETAIETLGNNLSALYASRSRFKGHNNPGKLGQGQAPRDLVCFYCHNKGHMKSECRNRASDRKKGILQVSRPKPPANREDNRNLNSRPNDRRGTSNFRGRGNGFRGGRYGRGGYRHSAVHQEMPDEYEDNINRGHDGQDLPPQPSSGYDGNSKRMNGSYANAVTQPRPDYSTYYQNQQMNKILDNCE